jgi:hypothetical protein
MRRVATLDVGEDQRATWFQASLRDAIPHGTRENRGLKPTATIMRSLRDQDGDRGAGGHEGRDSDAVSDVRWWMRRTAPSLREEVAKQVERVREVWRGDREEGRPGVWLPGALARN